MTTKGGLLLLVLSVLFALSAADIIRDVTLYREQIKHHRKLGTLNHRMNVNRLDILWHTDELQVLMARSKYLRVLACDPTRGMYRMMLGCEEDPPPFFSCVCDDQEEDKIEKVP